MSVTIADVAHLAQVSKATVSAVLNNKPGISQQTRDRVLDVVEKLNYKPNRVARSLSSRKTRSIGLVIKEIDNPYFAKVMKGVFDACSQHDYTVLLGSSELSPAKEVRSVETLESQRVDGLIISPLQGNDVNFSYLSDLLRDKYPLVTLGEIKNYATNFVEVNNVKAAHQAVSYLIDLGHEDITYFAGPSYSGHSTDRLTGYKEALMDHNISVGKENIVPTGSYISNGYQKAKEIFAGSRIHPSAIFCYNDLVAIGLINCLLELDFSVPGDVSVLGFDDNDYCQSLKIPLTTVHVPAYEIGVTAAELLIKKINHPEEEEIEKIILDAHLVKRSSCGVNQSNNK